MAAYTHALTLSIIGDVPGDPPLEVYSLKGNLLFDEVFLEGSFAYSTGGSSVLLSFLVTDIDENTGICSLELNSPEVFLEDGRVAVFGEAVPQEFYYNFRTQTLKAEDFTVTLGGVQRQLRVISVLEEEDIGQILEPGELVDETSVRPVKVRTNRILNSFDKFGDFANLTRFDTDGKKEENKDFRERIATARMSPGSSTLSGLANGISVEINALNALGVNAYTRVKFKLRSSVTWDSSRHLRLLIREGRLRIYSRWLRSSETKLIESEVETITLRSGEPFQIDLRLRDYTIGQLIDTVNQSQYYEASALGMIRESYSAEGLDGYYSVNVGENWPADPPFIEVPDPLALPASVLKSVDSREVVTESLLIEDITNLPHDWLVDRSWLCDEPAIFQRELAPVNERVNSGLLRQGDFYIDYENGVIATRSSSGRLVDVVYTINKREIEVGLTGVEISSLTSEEVQDSIFTQIENSIYRTHEERYTNGMPKNEFFRVLSQVLSSGKFSQYWGN